jgi:MOSC domain-containing protein YiiM
MDQETLDQLALRPGDVKENITTSALRLYDLPSGTMLRVGGAVLRVTGPCAPCGRMEEIRPGLQAELAGRRGVLARVAEGGEIQIGDEIAVV